LRNAVINFNGLLAGTPSSALMYAPAGKILKKDLLLYGFGEVVDDAVDLGPRERGELVLVVLDDQIGFLKVKCLVRKSYAGVRRHRGRRV
jgi:hypothetical protein